MVKLEKLKITSVLSLIFISAVIIRSSINNDELNRNSNNDNIVIPDIENPFLKSSNNPPNIPQLNYPLNESFHTSNIVKFEWNPVGNPSDDVFYEFMMDNDTDFSSPEAART